jgi:aldehyde:ferredoxin oxidoreductase
MDEPIKWGQNKGECLEERDLGKMLDEYYELHGLDKETGLSKEDTPESLGLSQIWKKLKSKAN